MTKLTGFAFLFLSFSLSASATTVFDEATLGFSSSRFTPTVLNLTPGLNEIIGTNGSQDTSVRDYVTIVVPTGWYLSSLTLINTGSLGAKGFIGIEGGDQITLDPATTTTSAAGLLGWWHYTPADAGTNLLPEMGVSALGSTGFTPPLASGDYAFWIQDSSSGLFHYEFDLQVTPLPEPATWSMSFLAAAFLLTAARKYSRRS